MCDESVLRVCFFMNSLSRWLCKYNALLFLMHRLIYIPEYIYACALTRTQFLSPHPLLPPPLFPIIFFLSLSHSGARQYRDSLNSTQLNSCQLIHSCARLGGGVRGIWGAGVGRQGRLGAVRGAPGEAQGAAGIAARAQVREGDGDGRPGGGLSETVPGTGPACGTPSAEQGTVLLYGVHCSEASQ